MILPGSRPATLKTMKYFALFLILICSATLFAQNPVLPPVPLSTPYAETAESWQNFAPETEMFSLEVPGTVTSGFAKPPDEIVIGNGALPTASADKAPAKNRWYMTLVSGDSYYIYSDPVSEPNFNRVIYTFAESQAPGIEPDEIYSFSDVFGYHHKILIIKGGDRVYTFQTVSATKNSASVQRFFGSIKIKGNRIQPKEKEAFQSNSAERIAGVTRCSPLPPPPNPKVSSPNGLSVGNSEAQAGNLPAPAIKTTPIKIISKPRASYTDYARFYHMTGSVQLRVTFMANGKIASVSVIKGLPFGLTEEAKSAACQMQFEPATRNDEPITVTKQVIYNFVLY